MSSEHANAGSPAPDHGAPRKKKKKKKRSVWRIILSVIGKIFLTVFTLGVIGVLTLGIFAQFFMTYVNGVLIPGLDEVRIEDMVMNQASVIYAKSENFVEGENEEWIPLRILYTTGENSSNREIVEYSDLPECLIKVAVAIEDKRFWEHHGVDWYGTARATLYTLIGRDTQGGSTITQQLLRNITEDREVTVLRKFREIFRALEFEKGISKEDILTLYLNKVTFGHAEGIGMAAKVYFGKEVGELDLAESAAIIAITNNPSLYDPFFYIEYVQSDGSIKTPRDFNKKRQVDMLWTMWQDGVITEEEYRAAAAEPLLFTDTEEYKALHANDPDETEDNEETGVQDESTYSVLALHTGGVYTWFEDAVIDDCIALIMEQQGVSKKAATDMLYNGGYHIYTTIDLRIQDIVDSVYENPDNFNFPSATGQPLSSAITVIDPYTGDIVAMAGEVGVKSSSRALNLARTPRQVGSSIKPVSVYAPAIDAGVITPVSVIDNYPYRVNKVDTAYTSYPRNDNGRYTGHETVTYGLQHSINAIAVNVLRELKTVNSFEFMENNLGFNLALADNDIGPLGMGGLTNGVTTEQMAAAFATFANEGIYCKPRTVIRIESNDHNEIIVDNPIDKRVAMDATTAYLMNNLLFRAANYGTGGNAIFSGMTIAGKTGTANNNYVRYFTGYTPYYAAAVWTGYRERDEKIDARINGVAVNPAAVAWRLVMEQIHRELGLENKSFFAKPDGITTVRVCADCGLLATELCEQDYRGSRVTSGEITEKYAPTQECTCHIEVRLCTDPETGEMHLAGAYCPEETVTTRIMVRGREFLLLGEAEDVVNEDGTVDFANFVHAEDEQAHLTYWQLQPPCAIHDEDYVPDDPDDPNDPDDPDDPDEPGEVVPGDPGYEPPEWIWPDEPDDPEQGDPSEPQVPDEPDDPYYG